MTTSPNRSGQIHPILAIAIGVVAVVGLVAAVLASRPSAPSVPAASDRPSSPPSAAPSAGPSATPTPSPSATPKPTPAPSATPSVGLGTIELKNATNHDVALQVHDQTDTLVKAESGQPGDGMSARWHDAVVKNTDIDTITITWAGLPQDDTLDLGVSLIDGEYLIAIVQAGPIPYSDAMGEDRIVILTFDHPVDASDISVEVLDRTID